MRGKSSWDKLFLREHLEYQSDGTFVRIKKSGTRSNSTFKGQIVCGHKRSDGYKIVSIANIRGYFHHAIWIYHYGNDFKFLDHKNGDRSDNRIENLRTADTFSNSWNRKRGSHNTHGEPGLRWRPERNCWTGGIRVKHVFHRIPHTKNKNEAVKMLRDLKRRLQGDYARRA